MVRTQAIENANRRERGGVLSLRFDEGVPVAHSVTHWDIFEVVENGEAKNSRQWHLFRLGKTRALAARPRTTHQPALLRTRCLPTLAIPYKP